MSGLRTRQPTGEVAWPLILVEGREKAGKTRTALSFSTDERVGRTFVFELGEAKADEYARLGPYEVVEHNGTFIDILEQLEAACAEPRVDGCPNVVVFDQISSLWDLLKNWVEGRARNSKAGKAALEADPDAEVDIPMNLWNDAKSRWYKIINLLRRSDVIGVLVARADDVAKVQGGRPVANQTEYRVEAEKGTVFAVSAQVRIGRDHAATLVAVNSLDVDLPAKGLRLDDDQPLGALVFDVLGCSAATRPQRLTHGVVGTPVGVVKQRIMKLLVDAGHPELGAAEIGKAFWQEHGVAAPELTDVEVDMVMTATGTLVTPASEPADAGPADPGGEDPPAPPAPNGSNGNGSRRRKQVSKQEVAILADITFLEASTTAPTGKKSKAKEALRYALTYVLTGGRHQSLNDLDGDGLLAVHDALEAIKAGGGFTYDFDPGAGVGFDALAGHPAGAVLWSELGLEWPALPARAGAEPVGAGA